MALAGGTRRGCAVRVHTSEVMVGMCLVEAGREIAGMEGQNCEDEIETKKKLGGKQSERKSRMEKNPRGKRQRLCLMNQAAR